MATPDEIEAVDPARSLLCRVRASLKVGAPPATSKLPKGIDQNEISAPRKIHAPQPAYPKKARRAGVEGMVVALAVVDREGCVASVKILKGLSEECDQSTLETVKDWTFRPAEYRGEAVSAYYNLTVDFKLRKKAR